MKKILRKLHELSNKAWFFKLIINAYPPYWGTGVKLEYVAEDFSKMRLVMPLRFYNKNAFGTQFGGSLYAMSDPFYCLMLSKMLGNDYVVWDKGATIDFIKTGRTKVHCDLSLSVEEVERIKQEAESGEAIFPDYVVEVMDEHGDVVTRIDKILYVRKKPSKRKG